MFRALIERLRRKPRSAATADIDGLDRHAPLQEDRTTPATPAGTGSTLLCREFLLGRDERIAAYRFVLRESTRNRIRRSSRVVRHVHAEVITGSLLQADVSRLLGSRSAIVELPDSFLGHDSVRQLPPRNTVLALERIDGEPLPDASTLLPQVRVLRKLGYRIALHACTEHDIPPYLRQDVDLVLVDGAGSDPDKIRGLFAMLAREAGGAGIAVLNLDRLEEFRFFHALGATWFHGPFITRREEWILRELDTGITNARPLLDALRGDADNEQIIMLLKRNAAIALRMLRHANAPVSGVPHEVESIEDALQLIGRKQLARWVMMALLTQHAGEGRAPAAMEAALVRARMMELLGRQSDRDGETLFLVGLLSLADVIMQVEMRSALDALAVGGDIRSAVLDGAGPHASLLDLAIAWEQGDTAGIDDASTRCGLSTEAAAEAYMQALWWTLDVNP